MNRFSPNFDDELWPLIEQLGDGVLLAAPDPWRIVYANSTVSRWIGATRDELSGKALAEVFDSTSAAKLMEHLQSEWVASSFSFSTMAQLRAQDDSGRQVNARFCRVSWNGSPLLGIILQEKVSAATTSEAMADRRDPLTGLLDRDFLESRLKDLLDHDRSADNQFAVLFVDLNNFKEMNDRHGHLVGDRVLREAARRLAGCVRDGDHVVRYGGDEFIVLVEQVLGPHDVQLINDRIDDAISRPIALPDGEARLSVSVGVAMSSPEYRTPDELLAAADRAMYAAKRKKM